MDRRIDLPSPTQRGIWKFVNYALATVIIAGVGIATSLARRRARNAYTMSFGTSED
jgi:hypothetical protein